MSDWFIDTVLNRLNHGKNLVLTASVISVIEPRMNTSEMREKFIAMATTMPPKKHYDKRPPFDINKSEVVKFLEGSEFARQVIFNKAVSMKLIVYNSTNEFWVGANTPLGQSTLKSKSITDIALQSRRQRSAAMGGRPSMVESVLKSQYTGAFLAELDENGLGLNESARKFQQILLEAGQSVSVPTLKRVIYKLVESGKIRKADSLLYATPVDL